MKTFKPRITWIVETWPPGALHPSYRCYHSNETDAKVQVLELREQEKINGSGNRFVAYMDEPHTIVGDDSDTVTS